MSLDDYSDSDDSSLDETEQQTTVLLGLPDGPVSDPRDLNRIRVSRLGGKATFPRGVPNPPDTSHECSNCNHPMEMLLQLWCPFESSAYDRTLHVWGCSRARCQRKDGSVKAVRAMRYNAKYAQKLKTRQKKETEAPTPAVSQTNPFTISSNAPGLFQAGPFPSPFDADISSTVSVPEPNVPDDDPSSASEDEDEGSERPTDVVEDLAATLSRTALSSEARTDQPAHPALYLDTVFEYVRPHADSKESKMWKDVLNKHSNEDGDGQSSGQWSSEGYERMRGIDEVFERFVSRVENEPEQCVRYDLFGVPLPFASESTYKRLFPAEGSIAPKPGQRIQVTGQGSGQRVDQDLGVKRGYEPGIVPLCPACGSPRGFECQLMPNLINVIRSSIEAQTSASRKAPLSERERKAEVARILAGQVEGDAQDIKGNMEWGTCMVFSCTKNCCMTQEDGSWHDVDGACMEEVVLIQWDV